MKQPILEIVTDYYRDGFAVARGVFEPDEVERIRQAFERLQQTADSLGGSQMHDGSQFVVDSDDGFTRIHRVVWCGAAEKVLSEFGKDPRIVNLAAGILDSPELDQLINQAHFKLPGDDVAFPWHQDSRHRRYGTQLWSDVKGNGSFVEIAMAIDPVTLTNGPIHFIPGSQDLGHLEVDQDKSLPVDSFDPAQKATPLLEPGDVVAFGPYVIHGSEPNTSSLPRRMFLNGFAVPGANKRVYPGFGAGRRVRAYRARQRLEDADSVAK